jgi:hypothetical protein
LLGHALLHIARGLADLEQARVRFVGNGIGVDARAGFRLGGEDFVDGAYSSSTSSDIGDIE